MDRSIRPIILALAIIAIAPITLIILSLTGAVDAIDLMFQALFLGIVVPLLALSVYMWMSGKGAMLIAGYNTSPRSVREKYDSKALAKFTGMMLAAFLTIMLVAIELLVFGISAIFFWALLAIGVGVLVYGIYRLNTDQRFLKQGVSLSDLKLTPEERKRSRKLLMAVLGFVAIVLVIVFVLIGSGSVNASLESDGLHVEAPMVSKVIAYDDITSVELRDTLDTGRRVNGFGGTDVSSGTFENDEFGRYILAKYNAVDRCIVVHHSGGVLVFNLSTLENTTTMYDDLRSRV